jgi:hypothetical protein
MHMDMDMNMDMDIGHGIAAWVHGVAAAGQEVQHRIEEERRRRAVCRGGAALGEQPRDGRHHAQAQPQLARRVA